MSTNFPGSLDNSTSLPYPTALSARNSPSLAGLNDNQNDAVIATQTKLGIGASTPTNNNFLVGTGVGTSAWTKAVPTGTVVGTSDSQTLTNKILTSPTINSPVITNATINTDTITGFSVSNTGTIYGVPISTGVIQTANTVDGAALKAGTVPASAIVSSSITATQITNGTIDYTKVAAGFVVQEVSTMFTAVATGTALIPFDDTIPQITEGTEFMTQAITPKATTNTLEIIVKVFASNTVLNDITAALFQDATANALAADWNTRVANYGGVLLITHTMTAGTTSSTTFRVRVGGTLAGTTTFNGQASNRLFGAITKSSIIIREIKV